MKSGIHHWLVFVGMKGAGNKFISEGRYLWFQHAKGEQRVYFHLPGSTRGEGADNARTASFSLFTTWWKNSQYFTEMAPLVASLEAPITTLGYAGLETLHWSGKCYKTSQMLRIAVPGGFPALLFNFWHPLECWCWNVTATWGCLLKYRFPAFPHPLKIQIQMEEPGICILTSSSFSSPLNNSDAHDL